MPRQRKSTTPVLSGTLDDRSVCWAPEDSHPSQVSGLLKRDPTFKEFRKILKQQHQEDYQQVREARATPLCYTVRGQRLRVCQTPGEPRRSIAGLQHHAP